MATISLDEVRELLAAKGITSHVEQTGGGCATLLVGKASEDGHYEVAVGPGWFEGSIFTGPAFVDTADLAVGPDDDGQTDPTFAKDGWTAEQVADEADLWLISLRDRH